jgi:hypothetical protein
MEGGDNQRSSPPSYNAHEDDDMEGGQHHHGRIEEVPEVQEGLLENEQKQQSNFNNTARKCAAVLFVITFGCLHEIDTNYMDAFITNWSSGTLKVDFDASTIIIFTCEIMLLFFLWLSTLKDKTQKEYLADEVYSFPTNILPFGYVICTIWVVYAIIFLVALLFFQQTQQSSLGTGLLFYLLTVLPSFVSCQIMMTVQHVTWACNRVLRRVTVVLASAVNLHQLYFSFMTLLLLFTKFQQNVLSISVQFLLFTCVIISIIFEVFVQAGLVIALY